jgi:CRISPR-associated endonuclease Cas1
MHGQSITAPARPTTLQPSKGGVLTLSGYGLSIAVERGHLVVKDGIGAERRQGRLHRATCKLKRLVVLGHTGCVTLEALQWLHDLGAAFVQIDRDGAVLHTSAALGRDVPQLRRAQAMAPWTGAGSAVACELLNSKLQGQAVVAGTVSVEASEAINRLAAELRPSQTPQIFRAIESQAAAVYWQSLAAIPVHFARRDDAKLPEHWRTIGSRVSPLTGSPRLAATPAHALLNYLYALLEAEARVACLTVGLDPGLGVLHADQRNRDSLACDLMEAVRPHVDRWLLELLGRRAFAARDFFETRTGQCRVLPPLTHELAETTALWARAVAPVAERAAQTLLAHAWRFPARAEVTAKRRGPRRAVSGGRASALPTPLTQTNRSAGRPTNNGQAREPKAPRVQAQRACRQCGAPLRGRKRAFCTAECRETYTREVNQPKFETAGPARLAELRAAGRDPSHRESAESKRGATQANRARARAAWDAQTRGSPRQDDTTWPAILSGLAGASLGAMRRATGLSLSYCAQIKQGRRVPHARYWSALRALTLTA